MFYELQPARARPPPQIAMAGMAIGAIVSARGTSKSGVYADGKTLIVKGRMIGESKVLELYFAGYIDEAGTQHEF